MLKAAWGAGATLAEPVHVYMYVYVHVRIYIYMYSRAIVVVHVLYNLRNLYVYIYMYVHVHVHVPCMCYLQSSDLASGVRRANLTKCETNCFTRPASRFAQSWNETNCLTRIDLAMQLSCSHTSHMKCSFSCVLPPRRLHDSGQKVYR